MSKQKKALLALRKQNDAQLVDIERFRVTYQGKIGITHSPLVGWSGDEKQERLLNADDIAGYASNANAAAAAAISGKTIWDETINEGLSEDPGAYAKARCLHESAAALLEAAKATARSERDFLEAD